MLTAFPNLVRLAIFDIEFQKLEGTFRNVGPRHARSHKVKWWRKRR